MKLSIVAAVLLLPMSALVAAQTAQPPAKVTAWGQHFGGKVIYRYEVQNLSARPIRRFLIGQNMPESGEGGAELSAAPGGTTGNSLWVSEQVASRPVGWGVALVYPESSEKFSIEWVEAKYFKELWPQSGPADHAPTPLSGDQSISPGTSVKAFSVTVDRLDAAYVNGHATLDFGDRLVSVPMVKADNKAPELTVAAQRINQNDSRGEWAIFQIRINVSDEFDPNPTLVVNPVLSNHVLSKGDATLEKNNNSAWNARFRNVAGRSYALTVRASDASGNSTSRNFTYQVAP